MFRARSEGCSGSGTVGSPIGPSPLIAARFPVWIGVASMVLGKEATERAACNMSGVVVRAVRSGSSKPTRASASGTGVRGGYVLELWQWCG